MTIFDQYLFWTIYLLINLLHQFAYFVQSLSNYEIIKSAHVFAPQLKSMAPTLSNTCTILVTNSYHVVLFHPKPNLGLLPTSASKYITSAQLISPCNWIIQLRIAQDLNYMFYLCTPSSDHLNQMFSHLSSLQCNYLNCESKLFSTS